jgi:hypothetical protein
MNAKSLNEQAKRLWGASRFPFGEGAQSACRSEPFTAQLETLQHWLSLHNSGFIHGNNGVGKSYLVGALLEDLNEKAYFPPAQHPQHPARSRVDPHPDPAAGN